MSVSLSFVDIWMNEIDVIYVDTCRLISKHVNLHQTIRKSTRRNGIDIFRLTMSIHVEQCTCCISVDTCICKTCSVRIDTNDWKSSNEKRHESQQRDCRRSPHWMKWIQLFVIQSIVIGLCCQSASTVVDLSRILISAILWCLWNKLWKVPWTSEHNWKTITSTIRTSPIVIKEMHRMQVNDLWTTDDDWLVDVSLEREIVFYLFLTVD
jgi:hypothetical protein